MAMSLLDSGYLQRCISLIKGIPTIAERRPLPESGSEVEARYRYRAIFLIISVVPLLLAVVQRTAARTGESGARQCASIGDETVCLRLRHASHRGYGTFSTKEEGGCHKRFVGALLLLLILKEPYCGTPESCTSP
jgi:hypothetical protein